MIASDVSILITDDDVNFRETLQGVFQPRGFRTILAGDGQEALDIVQRENIHLVLLDMHMPRLTGLETLRRVKQFKAILPCILMSARADEALIRQALLDQAFAVLHKPVSRDKIIEQVDQALRWVYNWPQRAV